MSSGEKTLNLPVATVGTDDIAVLQDCDIAILPGKTAKRRAGQKLAGIIQGHHPRPLMVDVVRVHQVDPLAVRVDGDVDQVDAFVVLPGGIRRLGVIAIEITQVLAG